MPRVNCRSVCSPTCIQSCCNCLCSFIPSPPLPWQKGRHRSLNEVEDRLTQVYRTQGTNLMALFHENGSSKQRGVCVCVRWCVCYGVVCVHLTDGKTLTLSVRCPPPDYSVAQRYPVSGSGGRTSGLGLVDHMLSILVERPSQSPPLCSVC